MPLIDDVLTGPRARFTLNGVPIALATTWRVRDSIEYRPIQVLNNIEDLGHVPVGYTASMNCAQVRVIKQTVVALGLAPKKGVTPQDFLRNILTLDDIVAQLEDEIEGVVIGRLLGVKLAERSFGVDARNFSAEDLDFVARRFTDEVENV